MRHPGKCGELVANQGWCIMQDPLEAACGPPAAVVSASCLEDFGVGASVQHAAAARLCLLSMQDAHEAVL